MAGDVVVTAEGVWKKYSRSLASAARHGFSDAVSVWFGRRPDDDLRRDEFWSLADVSLEVRRGETVGLLGKNGAGKTTLLKTLGGLLRPDRGAVTVHGSIGWLVDIGAGLHPHLTGRENVLLRADMLGLAGRRRRDALDDVIQFAEIGDFIDSPISFYSSGMKARLGFGIATMVQPDLLIIDETLSVGDRGFRFKCYDRVAEMSRESAVFFVSHGMGHVSRICNRGIHLRDNRVDFDGDVQHAIHLYESAQQAEPDRGDIGVFNAELCSLAIAGAANGTAVEVHSLRHGDAIQFDLHLTGETAPDQISVVLFDQSGLPIVDLNSDRNAFVDKASRVRVGPYRIDLKPGRYRAVATGHTDRGEPLFSSQAVPFEVFGPQHGDIIVQPRCRFRVIG